LDTVAVVPWTTANILLAHDLAKDHDVIRDEARELLQQVQAKSVEYDPERKVCIMQILLLQVPKNIVHASMCLASAHTFTSFYDFVTQALTNL
jgi:hypothetical protein